MFITKSKRDLPELKAVLLELEHEKSGARIMHIACEDPENLFAIGFQTLPSNNTGVAHILEHTVLCGSKKFPSKDPFFSMTRRSLATYMNALTGSDFTLYPAASELKIDFYNLFSVYLDALFHPLLRKESFLQEGWRLEFEKITDSTTPLVYRGIVYNEMKGAMASLDARLWAKITQLLFPTSTYGYNSGGEPEAIPSLSYEELQEFYKTYYNPSRAIFFFYGNFPLKDHLDFLEENLLNSITSVDPLPPVPREVRFKKPITATCSYPLAENEPAEERYALVLGWLTCSITDQISWLSLQLLESLLTGSDGSPFKKALLECGLCHSVDSALDPDIAELPFIFLFKGLKKENSELLKAKTLEVLKNITEFSMEEVQAALHQFELGRSEITGGSYPFGLSLCLRSLLLKLHGSAPELGLELHSLMKQLRKLCEDPKYLPSLIQRFFLENPHFVTLTMVPDSKLQEKEALEEQKRLETLCLNEVDKKKIIEQALLCEKEEEDCTSLLPKVSLKDIAPNPKSYALKEKEGIFTHKTFTNGLIYTSLFTPLPSMSIEELQIMKIKLSLLGEIGTNRQSFDALLLQQQLYSTGFSAQMIFEPNSTNCQEISSKFLFKIHGLARNTEPLLELFKEILFSTQFNEKERIAQLIKQNLLGLEASLNKNALRYAVSASTSKFSHALGLNYCLGGPSYLDFLRKIDREGPEKLIKKMEALPSFTSQFSNMVITAENNIETDLLSYCKESCIPYKPYELFLDIESRYPVASSVAFNALSFPLFSYTHPDSALVSIAAHLMEHLVLHPLIREKGGAYGARASSNSTPGYFTLTSYRDPHIKSTYKAFKLAIEKIAGGEFKKEALDEAKLSIIQDLDTPTAPGYRGDTAFFWHLSQKTNEMRIAWRKCLIEASKEDVLRACSEHLLQNFDKGVFVSYSGKNVL